MSKRAKNAALKTLSTQLFADVQLAPVAPNTDRVAQLQRQVADLRRMAAGGMSPRKFTKQADALQAQLDILALEALNAERIK